MAARNRISRTSPGSIVMTSEGSGGLAVRAYSPCTTSRSLFSAFRTIARTSVPSFTRISGPGICSGPPSTPNALTTTPGSLSRSGCHSPSRASRRTVNAPSCRVPAGLRLSLIAIRSEIGRGRSFAIADGTHRGARPAVAHIHQGSARQNARPRHPASERERGTSIFRLQCF